MIIVTTHNSVYEFNTESRQFRRVKCNRGKPRDFDNVWCSYEGEIDVTTDYPVVINRKDKSPLVTSNVIVAEFLPH